MRFSLRKKHLKSSRLPLFDSYKIEKYDNEDPAWEDVKKLETDTEIKKKVRACWNSNVVPDPNQNLTFHSYKAKRKASSPGNAPPSKRRRICAIDYEITLLEEERETKANACVKEMEKEMNSLRTKFNKKWQILQEKACKSKRDRHRDKKMSKLDRKLNKRMSSIIDKFQKLVNEIDSYFVSKICKLRARGNKNFQPCLNGEFDHTVTTHSEVEEMAKINTIYEQFNFYYS